MKRNKLICNNYEDILKYKHYSAIKTFVMEIEFFCVRTHDLVGNVQYPF